MTNNRTLFSGYKYWQEQRFKEVRDLMNQDARLTLDKPMTGKVRRTWIR